MAITGAANVSIDTTASAPLGVGGSLMVYGAAQWAYRMKNMLVAMGGTVRYTTTRTSGTGSVANGVSAANTDLWVSPESLAFDYCHCGIEMPADANGVVRSYCIQIADTYKAYGRVKMSWNAPFLHNGSGITAIRAPAASGEQLLAGSGTNAAPGWEAICADGAFLCQWAAITDGLRGGYVLFHGGPSSGAGTAGFFFMIDPLRAGFNPGCDHWMTHRPIAAVPSGGITSFGSDYVRGRRRRGISGDSYGPLYMPANGLYPSNGAVEPRSGRHGIADARYESSGVVDMYGKSSMVRWSGPAQTNNVRSATIYNVETAAFEPANSSLVAGPFVLPWIGVSI